MNKREIIGLKKLGDVIIPGGEDFPKFSKTHFETHIDRMLDHMPNEDRDGLITLFHVFSFFPKFIIQSILLACQKKISFMPEIIARVQRMLNVATKGVIFTLYYSNLKNHEDNDFNILKNIGWNTKMTELTSSEQKWYKKISGQEWTDFDATIYYEVANTVTPQLRELTIAERLNFIKALRAVIIDKQDEIIATVQNETNKSRSDILMSEIFGILDHLDFLIKYAQKSLSPQRIPTPISLMGKKSQIWYEPLGTILIISPWNYPLYQALVPITAAFITGNAVIFKPSELTPMRGLVEELLDLSGFKKDWVQVVYGDGRVGEKLLESRPQKVFFTGSVETGRKIMHCAAKHLIPVELELGGKDPMVVFDDANLSRATKGAVWGALTNLGQSCTSIEFLYVQEGLYDRFREAIIDEIELIKQEVDEDGNSDVGLMISPKQVGIVRDLLQDALAKGAKQWTGNEWNGRDRKIPAILLTNVNDSMRLWHEEIFGPIIPLIKFVDEFDVIREINRSEFGLSASVWSKDVQRCLRVAAKIQTGNVSINNVMVTEGNSALPFGGCKNSGIGRYKGAVGLHAFSNIKSVMIDKDSAKIEAHWYPYTAQKYVIFKNLVKGLFTKSPIQFLRFVLSGIKLENYAQKAKRKQVET